jgi:hypothetical protein
VYKSTHRALARAVRVAGQKADLTEAEVAIVAVEIADVCENSTPKSATFDREVFLALATQRQMTLGED